jgi:hypothetical protein
MIRPWYRSRLSWLGLPGLVFLLWLWWLFPPQVFSVDMKGRTYEVRAFRSVVEFTWAEYPHAKSGDFDIIPIDEEVDRLETADHWVKRDFQVWPGGNQIDYVSMRAWLPCAVYGVGWLALLALWQRRKAWLSRRAAAEMPGS